MATNLPPELTLILETLRSSSDAAITDFKAPWGDKPAPKTIYHYSTPQGAKGILQSGSLWLNDIFQMNDPSEIAYGVKFAIQLAKKLGQTGVPELEFFAEHFDKISEKGITRSAHYFVASFSKNCDELGQWRAYADDGRGYALGFDGNALEKAFAPPEPRGEGNSTFPLHYDNSDLRLIHERLIRLIEPAITAPSKTTYPTEVKREILRQIVLEFALGVFSTAIYFKHPAYRGEEEYRFLSIQPGDRPPSGSLTRDTVLGPCNYISFDWRKCAPHALKEIIIGPAADEAKAVEEIRRIIDGSGYDTAAVRVSTSPMPYRSMPK